MEGVVQENPAGISVNVVDLEKMRLNKLHEQMKASAQEAYEAHVQIFSDLLDAQERMTTIEPYWAGIVGDHGKRDAVAHLRQTAELRRAEAKRVAAIKASQPATSKK